MSSSFKVLLGVLGGAVVVLVLTAVFAGSALFGGGSMMGPGGMMGQGGMMGGGGGVFGIIGLLFPLLFFGGLIAVIVWAVTQLGSGGRAASGRHATGRAGVHEQSAEEILQQRFARGEIDQEEYEERHRILKEEFPAAHH
jgi:putative membrane protein